MELRSLHALSMSLKEGDVIEFRGEMLTEVQELFKRIGLQMVPATMLPPPPGDPVFVHARDAQPKENVIVAYATKRGDGLDWSYA